MGMIQVQLPEALQQLVDREIAEGRVASGSAFLLEAAHRLAAEIALDDEIVSEAEAGMREAEEGRYLLIASPADAEALHERTIARLRKQLDPNVG